MNPIAYRFISVGFFTAALVAFFWPSPALAESLERRVTRGPVDVIVRLEPKDPLIGDPIHLEIEALAPDGVELLMPEFGEALDRFLILDFAPEESIAADGRSRTLQRYTLEPPRSGEHSIPPLLIEFVDRRPGSKPAPEGADAYEVLTERIDFTVRSVVPQNAGNDLRPMPGRLRSFRIFGLPTWLVISLVVALLIIALPLAFRAFLARGAKRRRRSAYQIASAELEELLQWESHPSGSMIQEFYIKLSGIVRRYLENRFNLRSPELTTEEFLVLASRSPDLSSALRSLLSDFLKRADLVKFAGLMPTQEEIDESIRAARLFLEQTRNPDESPNAPRFEERAA
ncbi:MAG: hypothetical protein IH973_06525 [Myxococcales bacterium]|nr:hypothetical protein [Myxococcales bacterium]